MSSAARNRELLVDNEKDIETISRRLADWNVKGEGVGYTSSSSIIHSPTGRRLLKKFAKVPTTEKRKTSSD